MKTKANCMEKSANFIVDDWQIEKVLELSCEEFSELKTIPYQPRPSLPDACVTDIEDAPQRIDQRGHIRIDRGRNVPVP